MRTISCIRSPLFALILLAMSAATYAQIGISISFAPPELPVYEQPLCPGEGYLWTPGYWAYANDFDDYYWVPGTWVMAPQPGLLWTPAYWGWGGNGYVFYDGYWGPQVGFYGGISYGYGYFGEGYQGGRWQNGQFYYNRAVNNVNVTNIHNVYNTTVINSTNVNRISYNGGNGGITARPRPEEEAAAREKHIPPVAVQTQHAQAARSNPELRAAVNHGTPPVAATPKPGAFSDHAVVPAKQTGTPYNPPTSRNAGQPMVNTPAAHPAENTPRPGTSERSTPAPRNDVPRPPSPPEKVTPPEKMTPPEKVNTPRPENTPRPGENAVQHENMPRAENPQHQGPALRPEAVPETAPREPVPHTQTAPRPENTPAQAAPRPGNTPRPQEQVRPEASPRPPAEPHPQQPDKQSHPEEPPHQ